MESLALTLVYCLSTAFVCILASYFIALKINNKKMQLAEEKQKKNFDQLLLHSTSKVSQRMLLVYLSAFSLLLTRGFLNGRCGKRKNKQRGFNTFILLSRFQFPDEILSSQTTSGFEI